MRILLPAALVLSLLLAGCGGADSSTSDDAAPARTGADSQLRDKLYGVAVNGPALCRTQNNDAYGDFAYLVGEFCMSSNTMTLGEVEDTAEVITFCDLRPEAAQHGCEGAGDGDCWSENADSQAEAAMRLRPSPEARDSNLVIGVCTYAAAAADGAAVEEDSKASRYIRFSFYSGGRVYFVGEDTGGRYRCEAPANAAGTASGRLLCEDGWPQAA